MDALCGRLCISPAHALPTCICTCACGSGSGWTLGSGGRMGDDWGMKPAFCDCNHTLLLSPELRLCLGWLGLVWVRRFLFRAVLRGLWGRLRPSGPFCPLPGLMPPCACEWWVEWALCPLAPALTPPDFRVRASTGGVDGRGVKHAGAETNRRNQANRSIAPQTLPYRACAVLVPLCRDVIYFRSAVPGDIP
ncbi:hypothetical protein B0I37DRAFT_156530 [Chaetomium sp. MPI-CAGE-AT-0009]|nr:hypothetical protein B0I37DRAFT_156530 [Chaetomium sp. MPI-CAGE-AT-0009]